MKLMNQVRKYGRKASAGVAGVSLALVSGVSMAADPTSVSELAAAMATSAADAKTGALATAAVVGGVLALLFAIYIVLGMMKRRG